MWDQDLLNIEVNSFMSEKCEGDFHIFNGDSESESPVFWDLKMGRNYTKCLSLKNYLILFNFIGC
jgi:hypothetical protein